MRLSQAACVFATTISLVSTTALGGVLVEFGPTWNNFVFEPVAKEDTPNYYGYGATGAFGYSIGQVWDVNFFAGYSPGRLNSASASQPDATLTRYGAGTGFRILGVLFVGGRGGFWDYKLNRKELDTEMDGSWSGLGGEGSIGLLLPAGKLSSWQLTLDGGQATVSKLNKTAGEKNVTNRKLSHVSVSLSFVYNGASLASGEDALLNSFVKSMF
jgi:hypothetical protein